MLYLLAGVLFLVAAGMMAFRLRRPAQPSERATLGAAVGMMGLAGVLFVGLALWAGR